MQRGAVDQRLPSGADCWRSQRDVVRVLTAATVPEPITLWGQGRHQVDPRRRPDFSPSNSKGRIETIIGPHRGRRAATQKWAESIVTRVRSCALLAECSRADAQWGNGRQRPSDRWRNCGVPACNQSPRSQWSAAAKSSSKARRAVRLRRPGGDTQGAMDLMGGCPIGWPQRHAVDPNAEPTKGSSKRAPAT